MSKELIERLRDPCRQMLIVDAREAADRIEQLEAERDELKALLKEIDALDYLPKLAEPCMRTKVRNAIAKGEKNEAADLP